MSDHHTSEERVVHKLLGAAYQMTFDDEHALAAQAATMAVNYQRKHFDGPSPDPQGVVGGGEDPEWAEELVSNVRGIQATVDRLEDRVDELETIGEGPVTQPTPDAGIPAVQNGHAPQKGPSRGTKGRKALAALGQAMRDGDDWVTLEDIRERTGVPDEITYQVSAQAAAYPNLVNSRDGDDYKEYQLDTDAYDEWVTAEGVLADA